MESSARGSGVPLSGTYERAPSPSSARDASANCERPAAPRGAPGTESEGPRQAAVPERGTPGPLEADDKIAVGRETDRLLTGRRRGASARAQALDGGQQLGEVDGLADRAVGLQRARLVLH